MSFLLTCCEQVLKVDVGTLSYATSTRDAVKIWDTVPIGRKVQYGLKKGIKQSFSALKPLAAGRLPSASLG